MSEDQSSNGRESSTKLPLPKWRTQRSFSFKALILMAILAVLIVQAQGQPDCSTLPNTDSNPSSDGFSCTCIDPNDNMYWDGSNCIVICTSFNHNDGVDNIACNCNTGYAWTYNTENQNCIADCSNDPNASPTTPNADGRCSCRDAPKFTFDDTAAKCVIQCGAAPNAVASISDSSCSCVNAFYVWSDTDLACNLDCSAVKNTSSATADANGDCVCNRPYLFNRLSTSCDLSCSFIANTVANGSPNDNATYCECANSHSWNPVDLTCNLNCTGVPYSTGNKVNEATCQCDPGTYWNSSQLVCVSLCFGLVNTDEAPANPDGSCNCLDANNMYWDGSNCLIYCSSYNNNDQQDDLLGCNCNPGYTWVANSTIINCVADCPNDPNASPNTANPDGRCNCKAPPKFQFNNTAAQCIVECEAIANALDKINNSQCSCKNSFYVWSSEDYTCTLDCSAVDHTSSPTVNANGDCTCDIPYLYTSATTSCDLSCNLVANSVVNSPNNNATYCQCALGFTWSDSALRCLRNSCPVPFSLNPSTQNCDLNCSLVPNSLGVQVDPLTCACNISTYWDVSSLACYFPCLQLPYTVSGSPNGTSCTCQDKFVWNSTLNSCVINCSQYPRASTLAGLQNYNRCGCSSGYLWVEERGTFNQSLIGCGLDCRNDGNSWRISDPSNFEACLCKQGFNWNPIDKRCRINCSGQYSVGPSTPWSCWCVNSAFWNIATMNCDPSCLVIANAKFQPPVNGTCVCNSGYIWNAPALKCNRIA